MWNKKDLGQFFGYSPSRQNTKKFYREWVAEDISYLNENCEKYGALSIGGQGYLVEEQPVIDKNCELPDGVYQLVTIRHADYLVVKELNTVEQILDLQVNSKIQSAFTKFLSSKEIYTEKLKVPYKRGVLLFGPPGTGKTGSIHKIITDLRPTNSLVLFLNGELMPYSFIVELKKDPRLKILIFEEITEIVERYSLHDLLNMLDGENSLENSFVIATTNYPHKLPTNLADRQGRFDKFYKIDYLNRNDIKKYVEYLTKREVTEKELDMLSTIDVTIASLKEIVLSMLVEDVSLQEALDMIKDHRELCKKEFDEKKGKLGFT